MTLQKGIVVMEMRLACLIFFPFVLSSAKAMQ